MNGAVGDRPFRPVLEAAELMLEPGGVAELRAIGADGRISSGYFDSPAKLAAAAEVLDDAAESAGIYATLNPVNPALLARRANRVKRRLGGKDATTADGDILARRWLPVDVDPVRPSGVSATAEEHRAACATARRIRDALAAEGWPAPIVADSGNGGHLLYRVDLPNDGEATALVKGVLAALDARFSTAEAKVDTANYNAARIWKVYGTVGRKGDSTADRPHRRSAIVARPYEPEVVSADLLRALIAGSPTEPERRSADPAIAPERDPAFDLRAWLDAHGIGVAAEKPWQGGTLYTLGACPFSEAHRDGAYAVQFANGAVHLGCKHDSCGGGRQRWQELRTRLEPAYEARPSASSPGRPNPVPPGTADGTTPPASPDTDPAGPGPDPDVAAAAEDVLERGDPVRHFLDCFAGDHVGDYALAHCLVMSIASQSVRNSNGLHVYVTGESGKGKSSGMTAMLRQVPEEFRLAERMSNKALYYSEDIEPGSVFLLDDIALSEELQEVLKEATTRFAKRVRMRVVNRDRKIQFCTIPERCVWWLANVSALYDEQVLNRMLVCWVDDSEAQDAEVFKRKMAAQSLPPAEAIRDRLALRVCRELWRRLRAEGPVFVRIPFADRIRMASVRNRRNPDILLDLVRSHALCRCRQRERERLPDGGLLVTATEEDFRYAARLFADLHTTGGSLEAKFDRNENLLLGLAARYDVEQFTVNDVQKWTGWSYQKARRLLIGRTSRGMTYPGLLDRSPALSVLDTTSSEDDGDGHDVKKRQLVFLFNSEVYRESHASGLAWLEPEEPSVRNGSCGPTVERPVDHTDATPGDGELPKGPVVGESEKPMFHKPEHEEHLHAAGPEHAEHSVSGSVEHEKIENGKFGSDTESGGDISSDSCSTGRSTPCSTVVPQSVCGNSIDPRALTALDGPAFEPCSACGRRPSHYRELRGTRRLCKRCYGAAVRREQRAGPPLPNAIDPAALRRVAASVGRCGLCGLERAAWTGPGVRLCETCYQRESRRAVAAGEVVVAEG